MALSISSRGRGCEPHAGLPFVLLLTLCVGRLSGPGRCEIVDACVAGAFGKHSTQTLRMPVEMVSGDSLTHRPFRFLDSPIIYYTENQGSRTANRWSSATGHRGHGVYTTSHPSIDRSGK